MSRLLSQMEAVSHRFEELSIRLKSSRKLRQIPHCSAA